MAARAAAAVDVGDRPAGDAMTAYRLLFIVVVVGLIVWGLIQGPPDYDRCHLPDRGPMVCE